MTEEKSKCFGTWDDQDSECTNCALYDSCKAETKQIKLSNLLRKNREQAALRPPVIPPGNFAIPNVQVPPTRVEPPKPELRATTSFSVPPQRPAQQTVHQTTQVQSIRQEQQVRYSPPQPQPSEYFPAIYRSTQLLLPQEQPPFLSVPEPENIDLPIWKRIMAESVRAALKGVLGHGTYLADHLTYFRKK